MFALSFRRFFHRSSLAVISLVCGSSLRAEEEGKQPTSVAVQVTKVARTTLQARVTAYGTVETALPGMAGSSAGGARLAAASSGLVVAVKSVEGAHVEQGAVIVQLDANAADAAVRRAEAAFSVAEKASARQGQLQAAEGTSARAMQEAEEKLAIARAELATAKFQQTQLAIRSPLTGTLVSLRVKPGEWLDVGKEIGEVIDNDRLMITAQVPAAEASALHEGQASTVYARLGINERPVSQATVQYVAPQVTSGMNTVVVHLSLPKSSGLRSGQFVAVRVITEEKANRLAVPRESVYTNGDGESTLSVVEGDIAKQRTVQVGLRDGNLVEVSGEGLADGMTVVTLGSYALPKETKVRIISGTKEATK